MSFHLNSNSPIFVDSHCHIDKVLEQTQNQSLDDILFEAKEANVGQMLSVGVSLESFPQMLQLIESYPQIHASCGVHPLDHDSFFTQEQLRQYALHPKVVAIGEMGLDYHYQPETKLKQQSLFRQQLEVANELNKPVIIHTREAREDTLTILEQENAKQCGGVIHCFTEDMAFAEAAMALGFYISISGIVTFKQAHDLQDVVKQLPLERLLIETDSPFLAPIPYRGKMNQPAYVTKVAQFIADLKQISVEEVASVTRNNFNTLFLKKNS